MEIYKPCISTFLKCVICYFSNLIDLISVHYRCSLGKMYTSFWLQGLKGRDHWEDVSIGGTIVGKMDLEEVGWECMM